MRYITHINNLILFKENGEIGNHWTLTGTPPTAGTAKKPYFRFGQQGVLIVGDPTKGQTINAGTTNDYIYSGATSWDADAKLMYTFDTDLDGTTTYTDEMSGLGTLDGIRDNAGADVAIGAGWNRLFFPAPLITVTAGTPDVNIPMVDDAYYEVISGTIIYETVTIKPGEIFQAITSGAFDAASDGVIALTIPPTMVNECEIDRTCYFKHTILQTGEESTDYWGWTTGGTSVDQFGNDTGGNGGFTPRSGMDLDEGIDSDDTYAWYDGAPAGGSESESNPT